MAHPIKRTMLPLAAALLAVGTAGLSLAAQQSSQDTYPRDLPAALVKQATVTEPAAAKLALARVPQGHIQAVELENESGALLYSYEIKVPGRAGIEEVNVDAGTGRVHPTEHENPATERKEAASESAAKHG